jgi:hypothetical protein
MKAPVCGKVFQSLLIAVVLTSGGCSLPSNSVLTNFEKDYPRTDPDSVRITTHRLLKPPYLEVGYVYAQEETLERAQDAARRRAAEMGGRLIVDARAGITITQIGSILFFPIYDRSYFVRGIVVRQKPMDGK